MIFCSLTKKDAQIPHLTIVKEKHNNLKHICIITTNKNQASNQLCKFFLKDFICFLKIASLFKLALEFQFFVKKAQTQNWYARELGHLLICRRSVLIVIKLELNKIILLSIASAHNRITVRGPEFKRRPNTLQKNTGFCCIQRCFVSQRSIQDMIAISDLQNIKTMLVRGSNI